MRRLAAVTFASLVSTACASPAPTAKPPTASAKSGIAAYLPLEDGTVFTFETHTDPSGERGILVLEVRRPRPELAEFVVAGRAQRVTVSATAVAHVTGGLLLREPLAPGENWQGDFGHVRVTNVTKKVVVPAGSFEGCVETIEEMSTDAGTKRTTTAFCPGIGITLRETEAEQEGAHGIERIALKSYGKRFQSETPASGLSSSTSE